MVKENLNTTNKGSQMKIKCFKLLNMVDIITEVSDTEEWINPLIVMIVPTQNRAAQIKFDFLVPFSKDQKVVMTNGVMLSYSPDDRIKEMYIEQIKKFSAEKSGLILPG